MAKIDAWMPIYIGDLLKDTQDLSVSEFGAYHFLMYHYWCKKGDVPKNMATLRRVCKCSSKVLKRVLEFFEEQDGKILHKRLDAEHQKAERQYNQKSEAGSASAAKRASTAVEMPLPSRCQPSQSQSPSPSQSSKDIYSDQQQNELFKEFWAAYPRRAAKQGALKSFIKQVKSGVDPQVLIVASREFGEQQKNKDKKFIPYASKWLNNGQWEDEPITDFPAQNVVMMEALFNAKG